MCIYLTSRDSFLVGAEDLIFKNMRKKSRMGNVRVNKVCEEHVRRRAHNFTWPTTGFDKP